MENIIVIGCGRVGAGLATMLSDRGYNVCVIDRNAEAFASLEQGFNGSTIQGVGYDEDVLIRADVESCDVVVAVTQLDSANLMIAEVARRLFDVPHVIARLYNSNHERAYKQLGIDYVCGTSLVAEELVSKITSGHGSHVSTFGEFEIIEFSLDLINNGRKNIQVYELEREHEIRIIAFERADGSISSIPTRESVLHHGDLVMVCLRQDLVPGFSRYIQN